MTGLRTGDVGAGYVGLTTAVCLAEHDHDTICVDVDSAKVDRLRRGEVLLDEPGLPLLLRNGLRDEALRFATDYACSNGPGTSS
jgi:UDPglucose 6-dehydrogenase